MPSREALAAIPRVNGANYSQRSPPGQPDAKTDRDTSVSATIGNLPLLAMQPLPAIRRDLPRRGFTPGPGEVGCKNPPWGVCRDGGAPA